MSVRYLQEGELIRAKLNKLLGAGISTWLMSLVVSVYLLCAFNTKFFATVFQLRGDEGSGGLMFMVSVVLFLLVIFNLFLSLFAFKYLFKPTLMFILVTASLAAYFMNAYGVMIDKTMIQNMMETDYRESMELMDPWLFVYVIALGVVPAALVAWIPIDYKRLPGELVNKLLAAVLAVVVIGAIAAAFYQSYASLFRNNRYIRDLIVPVNYIYSTSSYIRKLTPKTEVAFTTLGEDAARVELRKVSSDPQRKLVTVLVVGETARSQNFSLNGYGRETNPNLSKEKVVSFDNFHSCGTATAVSVPCMFSRAGRSDFDGGMERYTENLLDVFKHAGVEVLWRDNNSGCKGVCDRVEFENLNSEQLAGVCRLDECYDMVLLDRLRQKIESAKGDMLIVLHQKGSHGPAYYLRAPKSFQQYQPTCHYVQLQKCSQEEITNAYDNTILYTDYFLSQVIGLLKSVDGAADASMVYVSDHGESLGENNIYLHGLPYMIAPDEQTHVPFMVWMSERFEKRFNISSECLQAEASQNFTQDNLFDSMLGLMGVRTQVYEPKQDLFRPCIGTGLEVASPSGDPREEVGAMAASPG
ncbi:phosphoethanolamine transferase [Hahella sp. HN01]|uniref:phosphoethanolamine transferase n=1 Tax=Hahella sp. HN01 TaxID=2847262 RepID=UPI001C1F02AC|nr:phosphoethanolamine--lipid A transferase [Hahella sp. HN01]MBU6952309.1 phosphoethanolamine--lipid A transferase [Hahella sp. HN01]